MERGHFIVLFLVHTGKTILTSLLGSLKRRSSKRRGSKKNSNIIYKKIKKLYHNCNLKNKNGIRKLIGTNDNCISGETN